MVACDLNIEPTAFECSICTYGDDVQVSGEPTMFSDLLRFQEETNSVLFGNFNGVRQLLCEICPRGHTLCGACTHRISLRQNQQPRCPTCREPFFYTRSCCTLPVFQATPADLLVIAQQNIKHDLIGPHATLLAQHPPTVQEKQADDDVQQQLQTNALLPTLLDGQPLALALQHEDDLLYNYLNDVDPARSYFHLLRAQMPPILDNNAEMDATDALLNMRPIPTQHLQNVAHSQMHLDLCNKRLTRLQNARPHPSYVDRLLERDPRWRERTVRGHSLHHPRY